MTKRKLFKLANRILGNAALASKWWESTLIPLSNQRPIDLLETEGGRNKVYELLLRIEYSVLS